MYSYVLILSLTKRKGQITKCVNVYLFTSLILFSGHRPAQRECARTGLRSHARGAIPTQSHNTWRLATPPGATTPSLFEWWCGFFFTPQEQINESAVRRDLRFLSLSEKTRKSNHLQMSLQRQQFLLSYFKTTSVGSAVVWTPQTPTQQTGTLSTELTRQQFVTWLTCT